MNKYIAASIKAVLALLACAIGLSALYRFEYLANFNEIDNIVGMVPVALVAVFVVGTIYLLFASYSKSSIGVNTTVAVLTALSVVLFPVALRGNWWINPTATSEVQTTPDLTVYAPFSENSKTAKLNKASTLLLADSLPVLDGATALFPVYAAFAEGAYAKDVYSPQTVLCTNTGNAYKSIISGERDIVFVAAASQKQLEAAKNAGVELKFTPIGREAFVFLVGNENPVNDISYQKLRNVYSGKTANWRTLGWKDGGRIIAFQRPEGSGSQTGLQWIMGELPIQVPQPLPDASLIGTNSLMKQVSVRWNGMQPALGYSYRYYATTMYANPNVKLLRVNGVAPTKENIQNGKYAFVSDFYAVTNGEPTGNTKLLIDWILSPQGQEIIEKTGYTPIAAN